MPGMEQELNLEKLKADPQMWMRLAMPSKNGDSLESVFKEKENPFDKNGIGAMETLKRLASEGNLYLRDHGRSRHFHKVEKEDDKLKLGEQREMRFSNHTSGMVRGMLMRMSRAFFKWIHLGFVSNWIDRRLKRREELKELESQYKKEYRSLSKEEKKELKALRKHEKNLKKLEKAKKEVEKTQQELGELRGGDTTASKGEMDSLLSQPPKIEPDKNTMQPTLLGDKQVQVNDQLKSLQTGNLVQEHAFEQQISGNKKEKTTNQTSEKEADSKNADKTVVNGVEITAENMNSLPQSVREALKVIQQFIEQQKAIERNLQQHNQQQSEVRENEQQTEQRESHIPPVPKVPLVKVNTEQRESHIPPVPNVPLPSVNQEVPVENHPQNILHGQDENQQQVQNSTNQNAQPVNTTEVVQQEVTALQERLAAEKAAMDAAMDWKDLVANALFSHEEANATKQNYEMLRNNNEEAGKEFLVGTVFGILSSSQASPEKKQQVVDALLSGRSLGSENQELISNGVAAYNDAMARKTGGNSTRLGEMLAGGMRELSQQASREGSLSPRIVMIGKLIARAAQIANENEVVMPLNENEFGVVQGAVMLAEVAQAHHEARQHLGNNIDKVDSQENRNAVRDLLMGNAVEVMLKQDKLAGEAISNTQVIMGQGTWSLEAMQKLTSQTNTRRGVQKEDIQALLENPNSTKACGIGRDTANEIIHASNGNGVEAGLVMQREVEHVEQMDQPQINPMNINA